jgi:putative two-component system hydrogenase maturation factor HypX/HoxX
MMRRPDRSFSWGEPTADIVRRIRAADGSPGVRTTLCGLSVSVFDAHPGSAPTGEPGTIALRRHGAVLVRTADGGVWIGQARRVTDDGGPSPKLPAAAVLADRVSGVPESLSAPSVPGAPVGRREITYGRTGSVGVVSFDFYNGAMSTGQCRRLAGAIRHAAGQDTRVLVLRGGEVFSNGIHLNLIEASADPAAEAWRNIKAIDDVCAEILDCTGQLVVSSVGGNAGAGGVMMSLGADRVLVRDGVVLNPHYATMGLFGSEYWTYVLPRRVGEARARLLTELCLPVGAGEAASIGMADAVLAGRPADFEEAVVVEAERLAGRADYGRLLDQKAAERRADEQARPLEAHRIRELAEMSRDIFDDRHGFADARRRFVTKAKPAATPGHLVRRRRSIPPAPAAGVATGIAV